MEGISEQNNRRPFRLRESIGGWSISCIITFLSQFSLLLVPLLSPSPYLLSNLLFSGVVLLIVAVAAKAFKRLLRLRASAPALVFFSFALSLRGSLFNGGLVLLVIGFFRILWSDPGLDRHKDSNLDELMHISTSEAATHGEGSFSLRRVHYCRICKDYVRGFDHHCPAFGNCIGEKNHILFMVLLTGFITMEGLYIMCTYKFAIKYNVRRVNIAESSFSLRRVRYCKICKDYVRGFDHHCPAFGNCIGEKNHILFMALLIGFITMEGLYIMSTYEFAIKYIEQRVNLAEIISYENLAVSTRFFCLLQLLWQVAFLAWHIYCICSNIRTEEWINWKRYPEFQLTRQPQLQADNSSSGMTFTNPYDKGILSNLKEFLSTQY